MALVNRSTSPHLPEPGRPRSPLDRRCEKWLRASLAEGPKSVVAIRRAADEQGFRTNTVYRARAVLCTPVQIDGRRHWLLRPDAPASPDPDPPASPRPPVSPLAALCRLREWRHAKGWSMQILGDLTGYDITTISQIERGQRSLRPAARVDFARRIGARIADIFPVNRRA